MSSSDYIQLKKNAQILQDISVLSPLSSEQYTQFVTFTLANTISNTVQKNNEIISPIFGMVTNVSKCPKFQLCNETQKRSNRSLNLGSVDNVGNVVVGNYRLPNSYNEYFTNQKYVKKNLCFSGEFYKCDEFIYRRGLRLETDFSYK
jgi:hypothetical protein